MNGYPASAQEPNDLHQLTISTANRIAINFFHTMSAQTISLGSLISSPPGVTTLTGPYRRLQVSATVPADYPFMTYSYTDATNVVVLAGTAAYFGNQNMTLSMPNLSGLAGVQTSWFPASGSQGTFRYEVGTALVAPCKDGGTFRAASLFGSNQ